MITSLLIADRQSLLTQDRQCSTFDEWSFTNRCISCPQTTLFLKLTFTTSKGRYFNSKQVYSGKFVMIASWNSFIAPVNVSALGVNLRPTNWWSLLFFKPWSEMKGPWSRLKISSQRTSEMDSILNNVNAFNSVASATQQGSHENVVLRCQKVVKSLSNTMCKWQWPDVAQRCICYLPRLTSAPTSLLMFWHCNRKSTADLVRLQSFIDSVAAALADSMRLRALLTLREEMSRLTR